MDKFKTFLTVAISVLILERVFFYLLAWPKLSGYLDFILDQILALSR